MERLLLGVADALAVALEILSSLTCTQIALLSCTTIVKGPSSLCVNCNLILRDWRDEEREAFVCKFSTYIDEL
jgi:hypothetical protein